MADYRYIFADLLTDEQTTELPLAGVSFSSELNTPGSFTGRLLLSGVNSYGYNIDNGTIPGRTAVYVDRDGVIVWGGVLWSRQYNSASQTMTFTAREFESFFEKRRIDFDYNVSRTPQDQLLVVQNLVKQIQSNTRTNLVVNPSFETNLNGWSSLGGSPAQITVGALYGTGNVQFAYSGAGTAGIQASVGNYIPVTASTTYTFSAYVKQASIAGSVVINVMWYAANGTTLIQDGTHTLFAPDSTWQRVSQTVTAPAGAALARLRIYKDSTESGSSTSTVVYVDAVLFEEWPTLAPYFDGTNADTSIDIVRQQWNGTANFSTSTIIFYPGDNANDINIIVGNETSGVTVTKFYNNTDLKPLTEAIYELSRSQTGFDWNIDVEYDAYNNIKKYLRLDYPRRGTVYSATDPNALMIEFPGNIIEYSYPEDGSSATNTMYGIGAGSGTGKLISTQIDSGQITAGWPTLQNSVSYTDYYDQTLLDNLTDAQLQAVKNPVVVLTIAIPTYVEPILGTYKVGDDFRIRITDDRFPTTHDVVRRLSRLEVQVGDSGPERAVLSFVVTTN